MKRQYKDLVSTRSVIRAHYLTQKNLTKRANADAPAKAVHRRFLGFLTTNVIGWIYHYLRSRFGKKAPFATYALANNDGVYTLNSDEQNVVRISLAADWATGTDEADKIARLMDDFKPHYTIHLGDTYFVGSPKEVEDDYFIDAKFSFGSQGTFSLCGNHEMYARGIAFYRDLLPRLGLKVNGMQIGQDAGYFCLENEHWRIIGIDTGYNSIGFPIIEQFVRPDCRLPDPLVTWLRDTVKIGEPDDRGIIFLSHHQYHSAFEKGFPLPAEQLCSLIGKERRVLWFWGHEHLFTIYGKYASTNGITAFGRCIGHAGMPIELEDVPDTK